MRWLRSNGGGWDADACAEAAKGGHLKLLKWLRSKGCPWNEKTAENAAREGHVHVLSWALGNGAPFDAKSVKEAFLADARGEEDRRRRVEVLNRAFRERRAGGASGASAA
jgi:hypothetical protein